MEELAPGQPMPRALSTIRAQSDPRTQTKINNPSDQRIEAKNFHVLSASLWSAIAPGGMSPIHRFVMVGSQSIEQISPSSCPLSPVHNSVKIA